MSTERTFDEKLTAALWNIARAPGWHRPTTPEMAKALEPFTEKRASGGLALRPEIEKVEIIARRLARLHAERGCDRPASDRTDADRRMLEARLMMEATGSQADAFSRLYRHAWDHVLTT